MTDTTKLEDAIEAVKLVTPDGQPWTERDFSDAENPPEIDQHIATILNAVVSGDLAEVIALRAEVDMTNNPVADLLAVRQKIAQIISEDWADFVGVGPSELATADRILAALTPASAEPVAWLVSDYQGCPRAVKSHSSAQVYARDNGGTLTPLYAHPAPVTVEAAAQVLLDQPYDVMRKAFDAMDKMQGEGADRIMASALRALSGEKS